MQTIASITEAVESFLLSKDLMGCTHNTIVMYRDTMKRFVRLVPSWPVTSLDVQKYIASLKSTGLKPNSIDSRLRIVKSFSTWAHEAGLLTENPARAVKFRAPQTLPPVPAKDEILRMLSICGKEWDGVRARTLLITAVDTGLRVSELTRLRWEDVDHTTRYLTIRLGKGQKDRVVPYGHAAAQAIHRWMNKQGIVRPEDFVFPSRTGRRMSKNGAFGLVRRLGIRAGLARAIGPHKLRHYFATEYLRNGGDLETLRQILGHSSLKMVLRYARLVSKDLGRVHRRASPGDALEG